MNRGVMRGLERVLLKVKMLAARGVVKLVNDAGGIQIIQASVLEGEIRSGLEHLQPYGFTSVPKPEAECVLLFPAGSRDQGFVLLVDDRRFRLKALAEGEVALYTDEGDKVHLKRNQQIEVVSGGKVTLSAPDIDLVATASITIDAPTVDIQQKGDYKAHVHSGVQTGGGNTGGVV